MMDILSQAISIILIVVFWVFVFRAIGKIGDIFGISKCIKKIIDNICR